MHARNCTVPGGCRAFLEAHSATGGFVKRPIDPVIGLVPQRKLPKSVTRLIAM